MRDDAEPAGEDRSPFGQLLREFRLAAGLSQEALAERAAVSADGISVLERGARRAPHRDTVALIAAALELSNDDRGRLQAAAVRPPIPRQRGGRPELEEPWRAPNLPLSLTSFHGREEDSEALQLSLSEARLVTLLGMGGVGKTRLALETARAVAKRFPDGVWCIELAPLGDPKLVSQRIAATLGVAAPFEEPGMGAAWIGKLAEKRLLLLLDNCEHVLDAAAAITQQILERCPGVRVLATSREALRIGGECIVRVDPLRLPAFHQTRAPDLADLRSSPAVSLFLERARLVAPTLKLGEDAAAWQTLAAICARLDGLPLAIELAAGRMNAMTLETLSRALDGRFHLLTNGARSALPRHQTLHALIDWSYGLLGEAEQRVFRRLAVFAGGWTLESAHAVCAGEDTGEHEMLAILTSLVDKSLIVADPDGTGLRYGMLETVRAYALHRLTAADERELTSRRHAVYFADLVRRNNEKWGRVPMTAWIGAVERDVDNLRAALQWSLVERHDPHLGAAIAGGQSRIFELLLLPDEGRRWCEYALTVLAPDPPPHLEAPLQLALSKLYVREAYLEQAVEAANRSVALYRALAEPLRDAVTSLGFALALGYGALALASLRRYREADAAVSEALAIVRGQSDVAVHAWILIVKSGTITGISERRAVAEEAVAMASSLPLGYSFEGLALAASSLVEFDAGDLERARRDALAAADSFRNSRLHEAMASRALSVAATCELLTGNPDAAVACARDALSLFEDGTFLHMRMDSVQVIGCVLAARGHASQAARLTGSCEALYATTSAPRLSCFQAVYDRTMALLNASTRSSQLEAWLAEGRRWNCEESIAAALDFERDSRAPAYDAHA
jgi:non-specific serine/threonine protein kinase